MCLYILYISSVRNLFVLMCVCVSMVYSLQFKIEFLLPLQQENLITYTDFINVKTVYE